MRHRLLPTAAAAALLLTGCGSDRGTAAQHVAERFGRAIEAGNGAAACRLLAPVTRSEVESSTGQPCAQGVLEEDLPAAGDASTASVWGHQAQVRTGSDTLFLSRYDAGWRVTAAGCTEHGDGPYDCQVKGA